MVRACCNYMEEILPIIYHAWCGTPEYQRKIDELNHRPDITMILLQYVRYGAPVNLVSDDSFTSLNAAHACISMIRTRIKNYYRTSSHDSFFPDTKLLWNTLCDMWKTPPLVQSIIVDCLSLMTISDCDISLDVPLDSDLPDRIIQSLASGNLSQLLFFLNVAKHAISPDFVLRVRRLSPSFMIRICQSTSNIWPKCLESLLTAPEDSLAHTPRFKSCNGHPCDVSQLSVPQRNILNNNEQGLKNGLHLSVACLSMSIQRSIIFSLYGNPSSSPHSDWALLEEELAHPFEQKAMDAAKIILQMETAVAPSVSRLLSSRLISELSKPRNEQSMNAIAVLDKALSGIFKFLISLVTKTPNWVGDSVGDILATIGDLLAMLRAHSDYVSGFEGSQPSSNDSIIRCKCFHLAITVLKDVCSGDGLHSESSAFANRLQAFLSPEACRDIISFCVSSTMFAAEAMNVQTLMTEPLEWFKEDTYASTDTSIAVASYHLLSSLARSKTDVTAQSFACELEPPTDMYKTAVMFLQQGAVDEATRAKIIQLLLRRTTIYRAFEAVANVVEISPDPANWLRTIVQTDAEFAVAMISSFPLHAGLFLFRIIQSTCIYISGTDQETMSLLLSTISRLLASLGSGPCDLLVRHGENAITASLVPFLCVMAGIAGGIPHLPTLVTSPFDFDDADENVRASRMIDWMRIKMYLSLIASTLFCSSNDHLAQECLCTLAFMMIHSKDSAASSALLLPFHALDQVPAANSSSAVEFLKTAFASSASGYPPPSCLSLLLANASRIGASHFVRRDYLLSITQIAWFTLRNGPQKLCPSSAVFSFLKSSIAVNPLNAANSEEIDTDLEDPHGNLTTLALVLMNKCETEAEHAAEILQLVVDLVKIQEDSPLHSRSLVSISASLVLISRLIAALPSPPIKLLDLIETATSNIIDSSHLLSDDNPEFSSKQTKNVTHVLLSVVAICSLKFGLGAVVRLSLHLKRVARLGWFAESQVNTDGDGSLTSSAWGGAWQEDQDPSVFSVWQVLESDCKTLIGFQHGQLTELFSVLGLLNELVNSLHDTAQKVEIMQDIIECASLAARASSNNTDDDCVADPANLDLSISAFINESSSRLVEGEDEYKPWAVTATGGVLSLLNSGGKCSLDVGNALTNHMKNITQVSNVSTKILLKDLTEQWRSGLFAKVMEWLGK